MSNKVRRLSRLHRALYRLSRGRIGAKLVGLPVLLLTTRGRRSGQARTVPLTYFEDGDAIVLVASYGGRPHNPAWFENLVANPQVDVTIGGTRRSLQARVATAEERARLWPRVVAGYSGYGDYQAKTSREIPLVLLER